MKDKLFDYFMYAYNNHFNINSLIEFQDKHKVNVDVLIAELIDKKLTKLYNDNLWLEFTDKHNYEEVTKYFEVDNNILNQYHILRLVKRNLSHIRDIIKQFDYLTNSQIASQLYLNENTIHFWKHTKFNDFISNIDKTTCKDIIRQVNDGIDIREIATNYNISADGIISIYTNVNNYKENQNRNKILKFINDTPGYMDIEHLQQHVHLSNKVCTRWGFISIVYNNGGTIPHALISIILDQVDSKSALFNLGIPRTIYDYIMSKYKDEKTNKDDLTELKNHLQELVDKNKENEDQEELKILEIKKNEPKIINDSKDIQNKHAEIKQNLEKSKHEKDDSIIDTLDRIVDPNSHINAKSNDNTVKEDIQKSDINNDNTKNSNNDNHHDTNKEEKDDNYEGLDNIKIAKDNKLYSKRDFNPNKGKLYATLALILIIAYIIVMITTIN